MKTAEEANNKYIVSLENALAKAESKVLELKEREQKYKELYEAQKELIIERDKPFANKYHGRAGELINKITALEQELGLKE
jgi:uncharacterized protein YbcI